MVADVSFVLDSILYIALRDGTIHRIDVSQKMISQKSVAVILGILSIVLLVVCLIICMVSMLIHTGIISIPQKLLSISEPKVHALLESFNTMYRCKS